MSKKTGTPLAIATQTELYAQILTAEFEEDLRARAMRGEIPQRGRMFESLVVRKLAQLEILAAALMQRVQDIEPKPDLADEIYAAAEALTGIDTRGDTEP